MATNNVPAGDPSLSQNAGNAALQWQGRTARMPQFTGQADADVAAGSLPNPTSPPQQSTTQLGQISSDNWPRPPLAVPALLQPGSAAAPSLVSPPSYAPPAATLAPADQAPPAQGGGMRQRFQHFLRPQGGGYGGGYGGSASGGAVNAGSNPGLAGGPAGNPAPPPSAASSNFAAPPADNGDDASGNPLRLY